MEKSKIIGSIAAIGAASAAAASMIGAGVLVSKTIPRPKGTSDDIIGEFADLEKMKEYERKMGYVGEWAEKQSFEDLWIESFDGLKLHASYLPAEEKSDRIAILHHGFTSNAKDGMVHAYIFHNMGYGVLLLDLRAHGESEGKYVGFGILDRFDTEKWVDECVRRFGEDIKIVLHGVSMGAATVLMSLGLYEIQRRVSAVIADCAYTSPAEIFSHVMKKDYHLPATPFMQLGGLYSKALAGYKFDDYSTKEALKENKVPVLYIHGAEDKFVPTMMSRENFQVTTSKKRILVVENAGHGSSVFEDTENYERTEKEFLDQVFDERSTK